MIDNLKDLERFFKLCRKQGITKADLTTLSFEFGDLPQQPFGNSEQLGSESDPYKNFPDRILTEDELTFYSAGGVPENDPALKVG